MSRFGVIAMIIGIAMIVGLSVRSASGQVSVTVTADNSFAVYAGDAASNLHFSYFGMATATTASQIPTSHTIQVLPVTSCDAIYIVAWSDRAVAQGLLAAVTGTLGAALTGDARWSVYASNTNVGGPPSSVFIQQLKTQINLADNLNRWTSPAVGVSNAPGNGVMPVVPGISTAAKWVWFQSNRAACAGAHSPFKPGCNHDEYLIFKLPLRDLIQPLPSVSLNPDFQLSAVAAIGNSSTFSVLATHPAVAPGVSFSWEVEEVDNNGNSVPGTRLVNPPAWWANSAANAFPGYTFQQNHRYKITRALWSRCAPWISASKSVFVRSN